jgi:dihydroxyacetone kinase-like predicted kinase
MVIGDEGHGLNHAELIDLLEEKNMEVEMIDGGQPVYHYIFGVE